MKADYPIQFEFTIYKEGFPAFFFCGIFDLDFMQKKWKANILHKNVY